MGIVLVSLRTLRSALSVSLPPRAPLLEQVRDGSPRPHAAALARDLRRPTIKNSMRFGLSGAPTPAPVSPASIAAYAVQKRNVAEMIGPFIFILMFARGAP